MSSEQRLHPYSILFAFVSQIRAIVVPGLLVVAGVRTSGGDWEPWMLLLLIPNGVLAVLRYVTFRFHYTATELVIRQGLFFRKERHIPYARIQNIDAQQNLVQRLLKVVEVRIETGAGGAPEATMRVLPADMLATMRDRAFGREREDAAGGEAPVVDATAPDLSPATPLLELDTRELLLCGFIENRGAVLIAGGAGVLWELGVIDRLASRVGGQLGGRGRVRQLARQALRSAPITPLRAAITLAAFGAFLAVVRVLSMLWALTRLYRYRVTLHGDDLRAEYGLLTRVTATIPLRRIQTLLIRETPIHRWLERVAVRADTAGGTRGEEAGGGADREWLAPILRRAALAPFVRTVLGGVDLDAVEWRPLAPRAFRREVKGWLVIAAILQAGMAAAIGWWAAIAAPALVVWAIVAARQTIRHAGWSLSDDALFVRSGWLWRRVAVVRLAKIQAVTVHQSPFDRRSAMARLHVDTAGASRSLLQIPYLERDVATALQTELAHNAAARAFQW